MKLKFTTLFIALMSFMAISTYGQDVFHEFTNNSFEDWGKYNTEESTGLSGPVNTSALDRPEGWFGSGLVITVYAPIAQRLGGVALTPMNQIIQNTDESHSENSSVEIITKNVGDPGVQPGLLANANVDLDLGVAAGMFLSGDLSGIMDAFTFKGGEQLELSEGRAARVYVWMKQGQVAVDNYVVTALATNEDNSTIIGTGQKLVSPEEISDWTRIKVDINYDENETAIPTRLVVTIASSDVTSGQVTEDNSVLIDDIVFQYENERPLPIDDLHQTATLNNTDATITWNASIKDNVASYTVQHSINAKDWNDVSQAYDQLAGEQYRNTQYGLDNGNHFYRLKVQMLTGETEYTDVMRVDVKGNADIKVWPNPVTNGQVHLSGIPQGAGLAVYSATGQEVLRINNAQSREDLSLSSFANGVYIIKVVDGSGRSLFSKQIVK